MVSLSNSLHLNLEPSRLCTIMSVIPNFLHAIFEYSHSFNKCVIVSFSKHLMHLSLSAIPIAQVFNRSKINLSPFVLSKFFQTNLIFVFKTGADPSSPCGQYYKTFFRHNLQRFRYNHGLNLNEMPRQWHKSNKSF